MQQCDTIWNEEILVQHSFLCRFSSSKKTTVKPACRAAHSQAGSSAEAVALVQSASKTCHSQDLRPRFIERRFSQFLMMWNHHFTHITTSAVVIFPREMKLRYRPFLPLRHDIFLFNVTAVQNCQKKTWRHRLKKLRIRLFATGSKWKQVINMVGQQTKTPSFLNVHKLFNNVPLVNWYGWRQRNKVSTIMLHHHCIKLYFLPH